MFPILQSRTPFQILAAQIVCIIFDWKSIVPSFFPARLGSPLHYCVLYLRSLMPSLFFYPSPFLSFMLSLSLLSWQRTRSKDIHHLLIQEFCPCCLICRLSISHSWDRVAGLSANSSKQISNSSIRRHNKISPGEKTNKQTPFYATDFGFIVQRRWVPVKTQWINNEICFDNGIRPL